MKKFGLLLLILFSGCAPYYKGYVNPAKGSYNIKKIAILPFSAPVEQSNAGKYMADLLALKLLSSGFTFTIVNKETEADAIIEGSIGEYGYNKQNIENVNVFIGTSTYEAKSIEELTKIRPKPVCALTIKLTESNTGTILWASSFIEDHSLTTISEVSEEITERIAREIAEIFTKRK